MITDKATKLSCEANEAYARYDKSEAHRLSKLAWSELFDNCEPTYDEFCEFSHGLLFNGGVMWRFVEHFPGWAERVKR